MEIHGPGDIARKNLRLHSVAVHHIQECHGTLPLSRFFETTSREGSEYSPDMDTAYVRENHPQNSLMRLSTSILGTWNFGSNKQWHWGDGKLP